MQDDGNLNPNQEPIQKEPTKKEKAAEAGKDVAEVAAKGAATYFGGPVGNQIANAALNTKAGQKITQGVGNIVARNPITRKALAKAQPAISQAKPLANGAIDALGANPANAAGAASSAANAGNTAANVGANASKALSNNSASTRGIPKLANGNSNNPQHTNSSSTPVTNSVESSSNSPLGILGGGGNSSDNNSDENKKKTDAIKSAWKRLPISYKIGIISAVASILGILILVGAVAGIFSQNFLNYSDKVDEGEDIETSYDEYWGNFCEEDDEACNQKQKETSKELKESQKKFYERLDKLTDKYLSKDTTEKKRQRYMVLTTLFYGYTIDDFTAGNNAFTLDESGNDEINENPDSNLYEQVQENDSLKELVKQFKVYTAKCCYDGDNCSDDLTNEHNETFNLNFWERVIVMFGGNPVEGFEKARNDCETGEQKGKIETSLSTGKASEDNFYRYLLTTPYFDKKEHLSSFFKDYAEANSLSINVDQWAEEEKQAVRQKIIKDIKDIVESSMAEHRTASIQISNSNTYWWPIGSKETTPADGKFFANGDPEIACTPDGSPDGYSCITSNFWGYENHRGIDLAGNLNSTNVIASRSGQVVGIVNECTSQGEAGYYSDCGSTWGNYVQILHSDGIRTQYSHLYLDTITVEVGDTVEQGQIIGKVGASGNVTGPHLHYEVWTGSTANTRVDPRGILDYYGNPQDGLTVYINPEDPRPTSSLGGDASKASSLIYHWEGQTTIDGDYYVVESWLDGVRTAGHGVTLINNRGLFEQYGINIDNYGSGSRLPIDIVDQIAEKIIQNNRDSVIATLANEKLNLDDDKINALVSFKYNLGNINGFADAYRTYGDTQALFDNYFSLYVHSNGQYMQGLYNRRLSEWKVFHEGIYP